MIPEDRIKESVLYKELESQRDYLQAGVKKYEVEVEALTSELEELRASRRANLETIVNEESQQGICFEQELTRFSGVTDLAGLALIVTTFSAKWKNFDPKQQLPITGLLSLMHCPMLVVNAFLHWYQKTNDYEPILRY